MTLKQFYEGIRQQLAQQKKEIEALQHVCTRLCQTSPAIKAQSRVDGESIADYGASDVLLCPECGHWDIVFGDFIDYKTEVRSYARCELCQTKWYLRYPYGGKVAV